MSGRYKRKLCRNYALGHCPQGDQCKYLHSNNIPMQPTYPMAPAMMRPSGLNPNFSFPAIATGMPFTWPSMSPPLPSPESTGFNWGFAPFSPPAPTASSGHSQPPQFRPLSWRTTLCRHFAKNQGWCPLGDECGYIHDLSLAAHVTHDIRFPDGSRPSDSRAGSKHSHCWAYVQGLCRVRDCPYLHPVAITLFVPHTPCLAWPNCTRGALCAYKHPEPLIPRVPETQMSPPAPVQPPQPPSPVQVIPSGTVHFYGTTYFPMQRGMQPPTTLPPPLPSPPQYYYSPAGRSVASGYSPYSPESLPFHSPYYEAVSSLPPPAAAVPRAYMGPELDDIHRITGLPKSTLAPIAEPARAHEADGGAEAKAPPAEDFPYQPPPPGTQRGHARRVSVAMKSKEEGDAGDAAALPARSTRRESWMHHRQRDEPAHKSWPYAPDAFAGFAPQQSLQLML
ncbi:zinc finger protein [Phanerochaete sordida]|uniref:Zinc finger protein n=1 Tax=Phanerochaete sordida TaxID=48140 RepID=A0A9P3G0S3_9APHY|nr:zinc finger protein [Phanerochaete sordida]